MQIYTLNYNTSDLESQAIGITANAKPGTLQVPQSASHLGDLVPVLRCQYPAGAGKARQNNNIKRDSPKTANPSKKIIYRALTEP